MTVRRYLLAWQAVVLEVAEQPHLLPVFLNILARVPRTVEELRHAERIAT